MRPRSTGVCRLRGEPRQCGDRAHRLIPPSMAPTGERRPSMACLRPIPAPPRLSPAGCPWLRRCRPQQGEGNARRSEKRHAAKDVAARGFRPSGTWMYRARVLEQDAEPRGGRNPLVAAAPPKVGAPAPDLQSLICRGGPRPLGREKTPPNALPTVGPDGAGRYWLRPRMWRECSRRCDRCAAAHRSASRRGIQRASQPPSTGMTAPLM